MKYNNTATVIALSSQESPSKTITKRFLNGEITANMYGKYKTLAIDNIDKDLVYLYKNTNKIFPNTLNSTDFGKKHTSQEAIEDFVGYIVTQLSLKELHRLNACLIDVEFFMQDQQAFRNSTLAKSMLRAEITQYQALDEQAITEYLKPQVDRIEKNLLQYQSGPMKKDRRQCLGSFLNFNLKMEEDIFEKVFNLILATNSIETYQAGNTPITTVSKSASIHLSSNAVRVLPSNLPVHSLRTSSLFSTTSLRKQNQSHYRQSLSMTNTPDQLLNEIMAILDRINKLEKPMTFELDLKDPIDNAISLLTVDKEEHVEDKTVRASLKRCPLLSIDLHVLKKKALQIEQLCKEYVGMIVQTSSGKLSPVSTLDKEKQQEVEERSRIMSNILTLIPEIKKVLAKTNSTFSQTKIRMTKLSLVDNNAWTWQAMETLFKSDDEQKIHRELDRDINQLGKLLADLNIINKILRNSESISKKNQVEDQQTTQMLEQTLSTMFKASSSHSKKSFGTNPSQRTSATSVQPIVNKKLGF